MTKMTTIPRELQQHPRRNRRTAQGRPLCCRPERQLNHDRHLLGNWASASSSRASWRETGPKYGEQLIKRLAKDLRPQFGRGFGTMQSRQNASILPGLAAGQDFSTLSAKSPTPIPFNEIQGTILKHFRLLLASFPLPWSAYVRLLSVKSPEARAFYETEALRSGWSVRQLDRQIGSQFYERIALSQNKAAMLEKAENSEPSDLVTPEEAIKDPFVLEFLDLKDEYSESDLEEALIQHLTDFLLELGDDFAFLGRQRRLRIDDTWFRIDLVFFHRRLRCLVIMDLKVGKFSYADAGQMHLYLNYATRALDEARRKPASRTHPVRRKGSSGGPLRTRQSPQQGARRASIRLSFRTKSSSPRNLNAPAGNWRSGRPSASFGENRLIFKTKGERDD